MNHRTLRLLALILGMVAGASLAAAPKSHTVSSGPFLVELTEEITLQAAEQEEIILDLETWSQLQVVKAAAHGTRVKKGDTILLLDTTKLDETIRELEANQDLVNQEITQREQEIRNLETSLPLVIEQSEQAAANAREDQQLYQQRLRQRSIDNANFLVNLYENFLSYQEEELRQLEAMYSEDELTEDTEEIILQRQRDTVERVKFELENARQARDLTLQIGIPRNDREIRFTTRQAELTASQTKQGLPLQLQRQKLELAKAKRQRTRQQEQLAELHRDRARLTVSAPLDGIVYHGFEHYGNWNNGISQQLRPHGKLPADAPIMTVVSTDKLQALALLPESALADIALGTEGTFTPTAYPNLDLDAQIAQLNPAPMGKGKFAAVVRLSEPPADLAPGMQGTLRIVTYYEPDALAIPEKAVFHDSTPEAPAYVWLAGDEEAEEAPEKRYVTTGRSADKQLEITEGLSAGDQILLSEPDDQ